MIPDRVHNVLSIIRAQAGGAPAGYLGGATFNDRENRLPEGRYRYYDVHPNVPGKSRGPERLIIDQTTGVAFYTKESLSKL